MTLDLDALDDENATKMSGEPLEILLSDISEDPNQPRKEFTEASMAEITESIKNRGVKTPISVRTDPENPEKWILNHGARRYRGCIGAEKESIPAFIDEDYSDYDAVIENIQRDDLKPMELAMFINKKLGQGESKSIIAKELSVGSSDVTNHLALIDPPECIDVIYSTGACTSAKTIYQLRTLHKKHPEIVEEWCSINPDVTRRTVTELSKKIKSDTGKLDMSKNTPESNTGAIVGGGVTEEEGGESNTQKAPGDPNIIKKALLLVEYEGRSAAVVLNRKPTTVGLLIIRYEDGSGEVEVDAGQCKIHQLTESA